MLLTVWFISLDRPATQLNWNDPKITWAEMDEMQKLLEDEKNRKKRPVASYILRDEAELRDSTRARYFTGLDKYDRYDII